MWRVSLQYHMTDCDTNNYKDVQAKKLALLAERGVLVNVGHPLDVSVTVKLNES